MDTTLHTFAAVTRLLNLSNHGHAVSGLARRNGLAKRQLKEGPIAGIVVGVVVFCALLCFCLYPVIVGWRRRRQRRLQRQQQPQSDAEAGIAANAPSVTAAEGFERRLSSTESVKQTGSSSRGELTHRDSKDEGRRDLALDTSATYSWGSHMITGSPNSPDAAVPGNDLAQHVGDGHMTPFPTYDGGVYYPGADPSEPRGANADYYSPTIPSEAFGMYSDPSLTNQSESSKMRLRGSSLRNSVKDLLRRASGRNRTMSSTTSGGVGGSGTLGELPLQTILPQQNRTDSPTEMSPVSSTPPPSQLLPPGQGQIEQGRGLPEGDGTNDSIPFPVERSFKYSPPVNASPGTVNPMDIMPASTEPEKWHRTDHDLYVATHGPASASVSPMTHSEPQFSTMQNQTQYQYQEPAQPTALPSPGLLPHLEEPMRHDTDQTIKQEPVPSSDGDVEMVNVPSDNYLHPEPDPGRHFSYPSDQSTPFPGLTSTNPSSHNTPSTVPTDTPTPESSGFVTDFRHSTSPAASDPSSRHGQGHFACTVPDCGQVFDQYHKLNHHARYHAKQHKCEYPNCGRGFGTKTHLQRHINDRHKQSKMYYCAVTTCEYSRAGGKSFLRKDNWKRHMTRIHHVESKNLPEPVEYEATVES